MPRWRCQIRLPVLNSRRKLLSLYIGGNGECCELLDGAAAGSDSRVERPSFLTSEEKLSVLNYLASVRLLSRADPRTSRSVNPARLHLLLHRPGFVENQDQDLLSGQGMGNVVMRCCVGVGVVRIMRPNGRIDDFDLPVTALEVMERYPQHLVIHSNYIERDCSLEQQRRRVTIIRPETKLLPGHEYILYPIPPQYREKVAQAFAKQLSSLNPDEEQHPKQQLRRKLSRRSQIISATRQHLAAILQTSRDSSSKVGHEESRTGISVGVVCARKRLDSSESVGGVRNEGALEDDDDDDDDGFSFYCSASWKPSLHSIPESPRLSDPAHVRRLSFSSAGLESC